eukprot:1161295-Pelagomonas_calceolata.AAC.13
MTASPVVPEIQISIAAHMQLALRGLGVAQGPREPNVLPFLSPSRWKSQPDPGVCTLIPDGTLLPSVDKVPQTDFAGMHQAWAQAPLLT